MSCQTVLLYPRPYARSPSSLLVIPLLPIARNPNLPIELWTQIFEAMEVGDKSVHLLSVMLACRKFKDIVQPLLYARASFVHYSSLKKFSDQIHVADAKWDSLRRSIHSSPGRWVRTLDVSRIGPLSNVHRFSEDSSVNMEIMALQLDSLLSDLFPLLPSLEIFAMNPSFIFSKRGFLSLGERDGVNRLTSLRGIFYLPSHGLREGFVQLLRNAVYLEELEVIGPDIDPLEHDIMSLWYGQPPLPVVSGPLHLPKLRELTLMSSLHSSPLMQSLLSTPLPSLRKLTISPYDDVPSSASSLFIHTHGEMLKSLLLLSRKSWPTRLHTSPTTLLRTCPSLRHLSLELPLPALQLHEDHCLEILSVPKPNHESWLLINHLLPYLPSLKAVRIRDVKWLRKGMGLRAMETGVQGEMREWRRRLMRKKILVLDAEWKDTDSS
ncbi:hypothetical protein D9757_002317 [Collybiopsis confluens]|uniref:F-box domain-containing protein n=1 Tax=Collybiopsis confluens TaxID=2823264 RepID=A0A8H5HZY9_9AGAR|nr:hypothetical protein D9757_002317 [Collybiopsis confluens]